METSNLVVITSKKDLKSIIHEVLNEKTVIEPKPITRLNRSEAADFCGLSYQTFSAWVRAGRFRPHGFGRKQFFLENELIEALKNNR